MASVFIRNYTKSGAKVMAKLFLKYHINELRFNNNNKKKIAISTMNMLTTQESKFLP